MKSNKIEFQCENVPRVITVFVEKQRDGQVSPITDVDVREIACGANHMVSPYDLYQAFFFLLLFSRGNYKFRKLCQIFLGFHVIMH